MADIFVSHRTTDRPLVERLAGELRDAGHQIRLDLWEVRIGDSIVDWVNTNLAEARYFVLCLSGHGTSSWMDREWMSTLGRQLTGAGVRILPVRLSGGNLPELLADIRYADLVTDWRSGVDDLLRAVA